MASVGSGGPGILQGPFRSIDVIKRGSAFWDQLKVIGDLSLHGATKPIMLDVTINKVGENPLNHLPTAGFDATTTLKRSEFGLGKFVPLVSDEIRVHIISQAVEAKAYAEYLKAEAGKKAAAAKDAVNK